MGFTYPFFRLASDPFDIVVWHVFFITPFLVFVTSSMGW